jgi:hypothetical protein
MMIDTPTVDLIPRRVLFGNPVKTNPQISPDGKRLAYLAPVNNVLNVWVGAVGSDDYHLDLVSGELTLVAKNPGNILGWVVDPQFKVRGALASRPDGGQDLLVRDNEQGEWRTLLTWDLDDSLTSGPVGFTQDGQSLYLRDSRNVNAERLVQFNIITGDMTVLAEDPQYDVSAVMINSDTYEVQAVAFAKDRFEWVILDESIRLDFDRIRDIHQPR